MLDLDPNVQSGLRALAQPPAALPADGRDRVIAELRRHQRRRAFVRGGALTAGGVAAALIGGVLMAGELPSRTLEVPAATTTPTTAPTGSPAPESRPRSAQRPPTLAEVTRQNRHELLLQPPTGVAQVTREAAIRKALHGPLGGSQHPIRAWLRTATTKDTGRWVDGHFQPEVDHGLMWVVAVQGVRVPISHPMGLDVEAPAFYRATVVHLVDAHTGEWMGASAVGRAVQHASGG